MQPLRVSLRFSPTNIPLRQQCSLSVSHAGSHQLTEKYCRYQHAFKNRIFICTKCYNSGCRREVSELASGDRKGRGVIAPCSQRYRNPKQSPKHDSRADLSEILDELVVVDPRPTVLYSLRLRPWLLLRVFTLPATEIKGRRRREGFAVA